MIEWLGIGAGITYLMSGLIRKQKPIENRLQEAFENSKLKAGDKLPLLAKKIKTQAGYKLIYNIPPGLSFKDFADRQDTIEAATNSAATMWLQNGKLHINLGTKNMPNRIGFEFEEIPKGMVLPIPIGYGRSGLEWLDLSEAPHMIVAGETFGGKSNFLHQALAVLTPLDHVRLFIIDLKRLEFSYMNDHALYGYTLGAAIEILEYLTKELHKRLAVLDEAGCVKIQEYKGEMPYFILVIDELSQLSPDGEMDKDLKKVKEYTHHMLSDLAALARAVGIHLILSTQRPDHKILPGQLKANIPAKLCYPVTSRVNSEIVLENDAAFYLPRIKGRGIFKWDGQKEIQTMFLPHKRAKKLLRNIPGKRVQAKAGPKKTL